MEETLLMTTGNAEEDRTPFGSLEFFDQIKLLYLIYYYSDKQYIKIILKRDRENGYISRLLSINALMVDNEQKLNICGEEEALYIPRFEVTYRINVFFSDEEWLAIIKGNYFVDRVNKDKLVSILKYFLYNDLMDKFEKMLDDRKLELYISEPSNMQFMALLDVISYNQINGLCYKVARYLADKVLVHEMGREYANRVALSKVSRFYENAKSNGWALNPRVADEVGTELHFYINYILNKDLEILNEIASVECLDS